MKKYRTSDEAKKELMREFIMGAHKAYYHLKAIEDYTVMLVSQMDKEEVKNIFHLIPEDDVQKALNKAFEYVGRDAKVRVVPHGTSTLLTLAE